MQTRRHFLTTLSLAGTAGFVRAPPAMAAEGPLETTTIRLANRHSLCNAPQNLAEELLGAEGFTKIRYIDTRPADTAGTIAQGKIDFSMAHASYWVPAIDAGEPVVLLAGVHVGCFELFAREGIHGVADLKGKSVGVDPWATVHTCSWPPPPPMLDLTLQKISGGSSAARMSGRWNCSRKARSTHSSAVRPSRRRCAPGISAM